MPLIELEPIIATYCNDAESVYNTWFLDKERLKAFRTVRTGVDSVIRDINNKTFGNDFKGSSLEVVVNAISEQKQLFRGADHAFVWKPKLRIPDIYENEDNKLLFGNFLKQIQQGIPEQQIIKTILQLDEAHIKGLGPAVANILYFLRPTLFPPSNTAIVNGFSILFSQKAKLGSWASYLMMREKIMDVNEQIKPLLSKDLGAIVGLLFEIGSSRLIISENSLRYVKKLDDRHQKSIIQRHKEILLDRSEESEHSEMQFYLAKIGQALGYYIWIAQNDHSRQWNGSRIGDFSIPRFPFLDIPDSVRDTAALIDVIWFDKQLKVVSAFEVEKSTSIYSGILRLYDLSLSLDSNLGRLYLVAPDKREKEVKAQLYRPAIHDKANGIAYILFSQLRCDCDAMCKYGEDVSALDKIAKSIV